MDPFSPCFRRSLFRLVGGRGVSLLIGLTATVVLTASGQAQSIAVNGGWMLDIGSEDLTGWAGSDLASVYESAADSSIVDVSATGDWSVVARMDADSWPVGLRVYVRRTSAGTFTEGSSIAGNTAYTEIQNSDTLLFGGSGSGSGVKLQYRVTGISVQTKAALYDTIFSFQILPNA